MLAASSVDVDTFDGDRVNHPINAERQTGYFPSCREDGSSLQEKAARKRFPDCVHKRGPSHVSVGPGRKDKCERDGPTLTVC